MRELTGYKDRHGRRILEGDIVRISPYGVEVVEEISDEWYPFCFIDAGEQVTIEVIGSVDVANQRRRRLRKAARDRGRTPSATTLAWCDWTLVVTNTPAALLSLHEALVLLRARWQVELLFKLWKSHGHIDALRSTKPWRVACEVFAKLLAMVVQHWILLTGCWSAPDRSLVKAAQTLRQHALSLLCCLPLGASLCAAIATVQRCIAAGCRLNRRKKKPNTYQLLLDPALVGLG
jgi:Transposase DDE domain